MTFVVSTVVPTPLSVVGLWYHHHFPSPICCVTEKKKSHSLFRDSCFGFQHIVESKIILAQDMTQNAILEETYPIYFFLPHVHAK